MTELEAVTEGPDVVVTFQDIEDSEFGGLLARRNAIIATERAEVVVGRWIKWAKQKVMDWSGRDISYLTSSDKIREMARDTVILLVGRKLLKRAQIARVQYTESDYIRMLKENEDEININIKNLKPQESSINVESAEPSLFDSDSDWDV